MPKDIFWKLLKAESDLDAIKLEKEELENWLRELETRVTEFEEREKYWEEERRVMLRQIKDE